MKIVTHTIGNTNVAEIIADSLVIVKAEDGLDLLGNLYYQGFDKIILHKKNITADFFDLKTGMAGEILQKFSNYRIQLVVVGDFSGFTSTSLQDFMYESNKGRHVNFLPSTSEALNALTNKNGN